MLTHRLTRRTGSAARAIAPPMGRPWLFLSPELRGSLARHTARALARARRGGRRDRQSQRLLRPALKQARLDNLHAAIRQSLPVRTRRFRRCRSARAASPRPHRFDRIVHLGAQAGVRYSIENPQAYVQSNLVGHCNMLELARAASARHMVYASSSSVYGGNKSLPFRVEDRVDHPLSLYAATKKADELLSESLCQPLSAAADGPALLHRLRAVGPSRHGDVDLHQGAVRGRAAAAVQRRRDAARLHLHRRYRPRRRRLPRRSARRRRLGQGRRQHRARTRSTISATAAAKT